MFIVYLLFFLVFWWFYKSSKIEFRSDLWLIYGKKGSGKSTLLAKIAVSMLRQGRKVYSTDPIKGCQLISVDNYYNFRYPPGSVVLIDEIGIVHDNRSFKSFSTQARDWYKLQRHQGVMVVACSQTADIDLKIRNLADRISIVRRLTGLLSITRYYNRRITVARHADESGAQMKGSEIVDDVFPAPFFRGFLFTAGWRYWKYFDSYAIPPWPLVENWDGDPAFSSPVPRKKFFKRIKERFPVCRALGKCGKVIKSAFHNFPKPPNVPPQG